MKAFEDSFETSTELAIYRFPKDFQQKFKIWKFSRRESYWKTFKSSTKNFKVWKFRDEKIIKNYQKLSTELSSLYFLV